MRLDSDALIEEYVIEEYTPIVAEDKKSAKLFWKLAKEKFSDLIKEYSHQLSVEAFHKGFDAKLPSDLLKELFNDEGLLKDKTTYGKIKEVVDAHPNNFDYMALMSFWGMQFGKKSVATKIWKTEAERLAGTETVEVDKQKFLNEYTEAVLEKKTLIEKAVENIVSQSDITDLQKAFAEYIDVYNNQYKPYYDQLYKGLDKQDDKLNMPPAIYVDAKEGLDIMTATTHDFDPKNPKPFSFSKSIEENLDIEIHYNIEIVFNPPVSYNIILKYSDIKALSEQEITELVRKELLTNIKKSTERYIKWKDEVLKQIPDLIKQIKERQEQKALEDLAKKSEELVKSKDFDTVTQGLLGAKNSGNKLAQVDIDYIQAYMCTVRKKIVDNYEWWSTRHSDGDAELEEILALNDATTKLAPILKNFNWNFSVDGTIDPDPYEIGDSTKFLKEKIKKAINSSFNISFKLEINY